MIEPVQRRAARGLELRPGGLVFWVHRVGIRLRDDAPLARGSDAVDGAFGEADRFRDADGALLEILNGGRGFGAGVGERIQDLLAVAV